MEILSFIHNTHAQSGAKSKKTAISEFCTAVFFSKAYHKTG